MYAELQKKKRKQFESTFVAQFRNETTTAFFLFVFFDFFVEFVHTLNHQ